METDEDVATIDEVDLAILDLYSGSGPLADDEAELLWGTAFSQLYRNENPRWMIELLRRHIPQPTDYCEKLADLLDPSKEEMGQLKFTKSDSLRSVQRFADLIGVALKVLAAEKAGEKRYLAVQQIAEQTGKSERHVWKALRRIKGIPPPEEQALRMIKGIPPPEEQKNH
jgi:hypothetical protein